MKKLPGFIGPQLAQLVKEPPASDQWIHEVKFDGYRTQAHLESKKIKLLTRSGLNWTDKYPVVAEELKNLSVTNAILDGEIVWLDDQGRSHFQNLQNSLKEQDSDRIVYYVFDLLFLNGVDLRNRSLLERKKLLKKILKGFEKTHIRYSDHVVGHAKEFFKTSCDFDLEGIVSKRLDRPYVSKRSESWVKSKCHQQQEFVIGGYTSGKGGRTGFGALLLGVFDKHKLRYVGRVGTGFSEKSLSELKKSLTKLEVKKNPFQLNAPKERGLHWVKPFLAAEVTFANWTKEGILRAPVFHGLREDKTPTEISVEEAQRGPGELTHLKAKIQEVPKSLPITHPEKVLYKKEKITKLEVAKYYQAIAGFMLPHIANRPLALVRCPDGTAKDCFFQKTITGKIPEGLQPVSIREKSGTKKYFTVDSSEGLLSLSQMSAFELHAWGCRRDKVDNPDQIVMDFDPGPKVFWKQVVQACYELKEILDALGLKSFVKLSGGKGCHIHIPIAPIYSWDQIKEFSRTLGREMVRRQPDKYLLKVSKKARIGKIFVDYLRNGRGATAVVAYSLRARAQSAVAMPVEWNDLRKYSSADCFSLNEALEHLKRRKKDPWEDFKNLNQEILILN